MIEKERATAEKINLTSDEAAAAMNVSKPTLLRWTHMIDGVPHFYAGRKILYPRQRLVEWANKQAEMRAVL